jgi:CheY-like chemotaxis protein
MPTNPGSLTRTRRVLVADDCADHRWLLRQMLQPLGFDVLEAASGRELFWALESDQRSAADSDLLVIADVRMPVYDGLDVLEAWNGDWTYPFVVMTSFPSARVEQRVRALGGVLLAKPFTLYDLRRVVERCVPGPLGEAAS